MTRTTLWFVEDSEQTFEKLTERFVGESIFENSSNYPDFLIEKRSEEKEVSIGAQKIKFQLYEYSFEGANQERIKGMFILFYGLQKIGFILDKSGYSNALSFLRELCGYDSSKKGTIVPKSYDTDVTKGKLFLWIVSRIYNEDSEVEYESNSQINTIAFNSLDGIKGNTITSLNNVSTQGSDVINTLTTLAFLLESGRLTEVRINLSFEKHNSVDLTIKTHSKFVSIDVKEESYIGRLTNDNLCLTENGIDLATLRGILLLEVHLNLIPMLYTLYKSYSAGVDIRKDLINEITEDVEKRIEYLKTEIS